MTDEKLIAGLRWCASSPAGSCMNCPAEDACVDYDEMVAEAADRLEALAAENEQLKAQLPRWISVKERLPEAEKPVLSYYRFNNIKSGNLGMMFFGVPSYFRYDEKPHWQHEFCDLVVTHWMPLPEAPSTEGGGVNESPCSL